MLLSFSSPDSFLFLFLSYMQSSPCSSHCFPNSFQCYALSILSQHLHFSYLPQKLLPESANSRQERKGTARSSVNLSLLYYCYYLVNSLRLFSLYIILNQLHRVNFWLSHAVKRGTMKRERRKQWEMTTGMNEEGHPWNLTSGRVANVISLERGNREGRRRDWKGTIKWRGQGKAG